MKSRKKLVLIPSAYNEAAMGDVENFIDFYKDDFEVYVIVDRDIPGEVETVNGVSYVSKKSRTKTYLEITADYIIDAGAVPGNNKLCASQKRISVWHGTPYKKMFVDLDKKHSVTAIDYSRNFDLMISPSEWYTERFLRQSMLYEGAVLETAISRTDSLFISEEKEKEIKNSFGIAEDKHVLLYAPTFRDRGEFTLPFSPAKMKEALGEDWEIVVKAHYLNTLSNKEGVIDATSYPSINNLMAITDLMVTDYSSVLFDYSVLGRPGLLYQYDREQYESDRSFMFSMEDYVDGRDILFDENSLYERLAGYDALGDNLSGIRSNFYPHQKKGATAELVEKLQLDSTPRDLKEVIFLVNNLNEYGGVHSFILNLAKEFKQKYHAKIYVIGINEYNANNEKICCFDENGLVDIKLSLEVNPGSVRAILARTDGFIITCQYSAQLAFQYFLKDKNVFLMFHGDTKDIVNRTMYSWHLDAINSGRLNNYKKLVFLTDGNSRLIRDNVKDEIKDKIISMENGHDFSDRRSLYKESGDFVIVSRLDNDKNPMEAVELFAREDIDPGYRLHIYGDGTLRGSMQERIDELGLSDRIILHGFESDKEVIYKDKQGTISLSLTEGLPLVFLESIKYGIPVYAYDSFTSCRDIISDNNGVLVETGNREAFVRALNDPFDMDKFSNQEIIDTFSNDVITAKWKGLFEEAEKEAKALAAKAAGNGGNAGSAGRRGIKERIRNSKLFRDNMRYAELSTKWNNLKHRKWSKDQPLVSIIMPFYNNNATVAAAVRSIERSGYNNFEILLINDGSKEDPRGLLGDRKKLRYFYKENGGLSDTRNYGIERAKGKYVLFLDSDDLLYPNSLNRLAMYAEKKKLSMVAGKTVRRYVSTGEEESWYPKVYEKTYVNQLKDRRMLIDDTIATGKLYSREMLISEDVKFKKGLYEDVLFTGQLYAALDKIGVVSCIVQKWMIYGNNTSITTNRTFSNALARLNNVDAVFRMQKSELNKVFYTRQYIRHQIIAALGGFNNFTDEQKREIFEELKKGMEIRRPYAIDKLQAYPSKKELYKALLNDDFERFSLIATGFSADQLEKQQSDRS